MVVDDAEMAITHVIRGEDHLSNTPKHILLFRALGTPVPRFAHLPLILNADRTKMSKRKSQTAVSRLHRRGVPARGAGQLPGAARLVEQDRGRGLRRSTSSRRCSTSTRIHKGGAVFDRERLEWLNGQWIRRLEPDELIERLRPFVETELAEGRIDRMPSDDELRSLLPVVQERLPTLGAIGALVGFLWVETVPVDAETLVPKRWDAATTLAGLTAAREVIAETGDGDASRPTSSSRRSGRSPRSAAGRPATCSWRSVSR